MKVLKFAYYGKGIKKNNSYLQSAKRSPEILYKHIKKVRYMINKTF